MALHASVEIARLAQAGATETCDTAGVLAPAVSVVSSLQVVDALKILTGQADLIENVLTVIDVWDGTWRRLGRAMGKGSRTFRGVARKILEWTRG